MRRSRIRSRKNPRAANPCRKKKPSRRRIGARPRGTEPSRRARRPVRTSRRSPIRRGEDKHRWSRAAPRPRREAARSRRRPRRARCARRARTAQTQTPPRSARIQTPCDTRASTVSCAARAPKAASSVRRYKKQLDRGRAASRSRAAPRRRTGTSANAAASPPRRARALRARGEPRGVDPGEHERVPGSIPYQIRWLEEHGVRHDGAFRRGPRGDFFIRAV